MYSEVTETTELHMLQQDLQLCTNSLRQMKDGVLIVRQNRCLPCSGEFSGSSVIKT